MKVIGSRYQFDYPDFGTPDGFPDHTAHRGQVVVVIRQLGPDEADAEVGPMYEVKADDGWTGYAYEDELREVV